MEWAVALRATEAEYAGRHAGSRRAMERMAAWLPGGDTRSTTWSGPFPLVMDHADGIELVDVDGNVLIDCLGNYTALDPRPSAPIRPGGAAARRSSATSCSARPCSSRASWGAASSSASAPPSGSASPTPGRRPGMVAARVARRFSGT